MPTVLAVAESDAYLKWVAWLLDGVDWPAEITVLGSDIAPSDRQRDAAVAGTRLDGAVLDDTLWSLRRRVRTRSPDVLLLACTGPTIALVTSLLPRRAHGVLVVAGLPGIGVPVRARAIRARRGVDVFVAHSRRERDEYAAAFAAAAAPDGSEATVVALATLPFLDYDMHQLDVAGGDERGPVVFAPQPSVPPRREDRLHLLSRLAELGPPPPVVKLRSRASEAATHREPHGYEELWGELVRAGSVVDGTLEFADGALTESLAQASCLVTVSSTAALEAIGRGCPVVVIDDFGLNDELLNGVFVGSGITGPLARPTIASRPRPDPTWLERNYFHGRASDDWAQVIVDRLAAGARRRRRVGLRTWASRTVVSKGWRLVRAATRRR